MSEKEITENNNLIVKFMGFRSELVEIDTNFNESIFKIMSDTHLFYKRFRINDVVKENGFNENNPDEYFLRLIKLYYHVSWDWLMKVVSKIESLESGIYQVDILQEGCKILKRNQLLIDKTVSQVPVNITKIQSVFLAIVEFIKLYNNDKL